jgi:hypothetical protein
MRKLLVVHRLLEAEERLAEREPRRTADGPRALFLFLVGGLPAGGRFRGENRAWSPADVVALWSPGEAVS